MSLVTSSPTGGGVGRTRTDRAGRSQWRRILARLLRARGARVGLPQLALAATRTGIGVPVHSRISDIRRHGYQVDNFPETKRDGTRASFYVLTLP